MCVCECECEYESESVGVSESERERESEYERVSSKKDLLQSRWHMSVTGPSLPVRTDPIGTASCLATCDL